MKIIIFIVMFLLIGAFFIVSNENIKLNSKENMDYFLGEYTGWLSRLTDNSVTVVGYVVKLGWLPEN